MDFDTFFLSQKPQIPQSFTLVSPATASEKQILDKRVLKLQQFFKSKDSILVNYAQLFVNYADKYDLDWRLLPAISGVESTFAKAMPKNSFNAFGWAQGNQYFTSWDDSIQHISQILREKYLDKGHETVAQIGSMYCPDSATWISNVKKFIDEIENTQTSVPELSYVNARPLIF
ncbi:MAG TPA: hypothetical protein VF837_02980 [Patescibacteria group bacterium]